MNENENSYVPVNPHENYPDSGQTVEVPAMKVIPLKKICMTIGELPSSYLETMTYYEMLVWFINYLRDNIIPTVNGNGEAVEELQTVVMELQNYINNFKDSIDEDVEDLETFVNDYFENLDVQEEINNKLDEYLEDGTLGHIIASYLQTQKIYNTHVEMMADADSLVAGLNVQTLGYYTLNDGGGAFYQITDTESSTTYQDDLGNDLYATLMYTNVLNVKQFGAKGDGTTDDSSIIKNIIENIADDGDTVYFPNGVYVYNQLITCNKAIRIKGDGTRPYHYDESCLKNTGDYGIVLTSNSKVEDIDFIGDQTHNGYGLKMIGGRPYLVNCSFDHFENSSGLIIGDENTYYNTDLCYMENIFINHCDIGLNFGGALSQSSQSDNNAGTIAGLIISNCRIGIYLRNSQANNFLSLEINTCSEYGMYFVNSSNNMVLNPYLESTKNIYFDTNSVNNRIFGSRQNGWIGQNEGNTDNNLVLGNSQGKGIFNIWTYVNGQAFKLAKDDQNGYFDITHDTHTLSVKHSQSGGIIDLSNSTYKQTTKTNTVMLNSNVPLTGTTHNYGGLTNVTIPANGVFTQNVVNSALTIESDRMHWHGNVSFTTALPTGVIGTVECQSGMFVIKLYNTTSSDITYTSLYTIFGIKANGNA